MFANWKLRDRLLAGYGVPVLLLIGVSIVSFTSANTILEKLSRNYLIQNFMFDSDEIFTFDALMSGESHSYLLTGNSSNLDNFQNYKNQLNELIDVWQQKLNRLRPEEQAEFKQLITLEDEHIKILSKINDLRRKNQQSSITEISSLIPKSAKIHDDISKVNQDINDKGTEAHTNNLKQTVQALNSSGFTAMGSTIVAVVVVLIIASVIIRQILELVSQVQKSGIQIATSITEISALGKQLEATMTEQAASTSEVTATAKEIATTSEQLVKTMDEVERTADLTAQSAGNSQEELRHMEQSMKELADATSVISHKLGAINDKASNINNIVNTITKVADQTNMLSLNAAIEAEKAGEYGTGFAVVAREIRRLADQTAVATLDIENMVREMQGAVSTGVMEMDKFSKEVKYSVDNVGNIGEKLASIIEQVQTLTPRFQQVSNSVGGQSQGAIQISEAMAQLSESSEDTISALAEVNKSLGDMSDTAQILHQEIAGLGASNN
jgi:methyl-accepting chemotaxis protein WspA